MLLPNPRAAPVLPLVRTCPNRSNSPKKSLGHAFSSMLNSRPHPLLKSLAEREVGISLRSWDREAAGERNLSNLKAHSGSPNELWGDPGGI